MSDTLLLLCAAAGGDLPSFATAMITILLPVAPLVLAFLVAALIRVATGSATVALTTSAGTVAPVAAASPVPVPAELLVLAAGSGSLILSQPL